MTDAAAASGLAEPRTEFVKALTLTGAVARRPRLVLLGVPIYHLWRRLTTA